MQRLEVSGAVRPIYVSLGVKRLTTTGGYCNSKVAFMERHLAGEHRNAARNSSSNATLPTADPTQFAPGFNGEKQVANDRATHRIV